MPELREAVSARPTGFCVLCALAQSMIRRRTWSSEGSTCPPRRGVKESHALTSENANSNVDFGRS
jgi:hypothetical protein